MPITAPGSPDAMSKKIHLIAIGGAVMHNLALSLQRQGFAVSGSDDHIAEPSKSRLAAAGLLPEQEGWFSESIRPDLDGVILGMHARADNPELLKALELGLPVWSFPEFIYLQSAKKLRVAICGSHGKTTITAMVMHILKAYGRSFDYLVGAQLAGFDVMVQLSDAPVIVLEGDEYLASALDRRPKFLHYRPRIALISGIAWDHMNVFPTYNSYLDAFRSLLTELSPEDHLVYDDADPELRKLVGEGCAAALHPYRQPAFRVDGGKLVVEPDGKVPSTPLELIGEHNVRNAAGAACVATLLGVPPREAWHALSDFRGAARRLEVFAGQAGKIMIRDFAHSPSKVAASTAAVSGQFGRAGLLACLELHTFSSLNPEFLPQYANSLDAAEEAIVFYDPEAVRAKKLPPLNARAVEQAFGRKDLAVFNDRESLRRFLLDRLPSVSTLLLMSSGTFGGLDLAELGSRFSPTLST